MITKDSTLSEVRRIYRGDHRDAVDLVNPRMVRSIQQGLATEGYVFSLESILRVGERLYRERA